MSNSIRPTTATALSLLILYFSFLLSLKQFTFSNGVSASLDSSTFANQMDDFITFLILYFFFFAASDAEEWSSTEAATGKYNRRNGK